jgi:hypothetical protein
MSAHVLIDFEVRPVKGYTIEHLDPPLPTWWLVRRNDDPDGYALALTPQMVAAAVFARAVSADTETTYDYGVSWYLHGVSGERFREVVTTEGDSGS